ncbi:hypothetical protein KVG95_28300 [Pseudomonas sp. SWRI79]|uniref:Uncharacterized protein n=1 Tax=Pseudomonas farris TaxID=2841207 RepID=A0ABS6Q3D4_9PSED|nr:hypothetical protein [Pseudomonas farris]MBV4467220.1 hypothetical protein [Pseudomonas farris]
MKGWLIGGTICMAVIGAFIYGVSAWEAIENQKRDALCSVARQHVEVLETRARAMAAGLSVEAYAEAEDAEVAALIYALDAATTDAEVDAVIEAHAAMIETQITARAAEVDARGDQLFLEQRLIKQRIPTDFKQEIKRAEKAVRVVCS